MPTSLLALLDDVTTVLDDVAAMTKVATKKTAGVLGDDLALNAEQVAGVDASRELPVVWAVAKGSAINKLILVPAALGVSALAPWAITPLLMVGGAFLCFEGFEKVAHKLLHSAEREVKSEKTPVVPPADLATLEKNKIRGAIRTDFILSAEIVVISLGTVASAPLAKQVVVLSAIAAIMTVGVYGLVAGIVKLDDLGLWLLKKKGASAKIGSGILAAAPYLMKFLSIAGTIAMFLVGGGILAHGIGPVHHLVEGFEKTGGFVGAVLPSLVNAAVGIVTGGVIVGLLTVGKRIVQRTSQSVQAAQ